MPITALSIRNFRSIVSFSDDIAQLNIFVGQNDEGKSNVLRALDLFFNHDKKHGYDLQWGRDYCYFAPLRQRKAEEITIELEVTPPPSFMGDQPVLWRRVWRRDGLHEDRVRNRDGTELLPRSKIPAFLSAMRFDYVPAIKGDKYFQFLMSMLHDMLEATVEDQIRQASGSFTKAINKNTKSILADIRDRLGLDTTIELPPNLRELFAQLEFTSLSGAKPFSLQQRGDGIKVRHIPIVLRWLADQANYLSAPGRPKAVTIWGYEEPENNLEMRRCFELAQEFVEGSETIQAFVTTHSPAFYSVFRDSRDDGVKLFLVTKNGTPPTSVITPLEDTDVCSLDTAMGLLECLEPYIKVVRDELDRVREVQATLQDTSKPTLFCEGPSDKTLIEQVLADLFPKIASSVVVRCSDHNGGGHEWVADMVIAWSFSRPTAKAVGLFDKDKAAQRSRKKLEKRVKDGGKKYVKWVSLVPGSELKECLKKKLKVPYAIEELLPEDLWDHAESQDWLEDRPKPVQIYGFDRTDVTFNDHLDELLPDSHHQRLALRKVKLEAKEELTDYVLGMPKAERQRVLEGLKPTLEECLKQLEVDGDNK